MNIRVGLGILAMAFIVVLSNYLVTKPFGTYLTLGAFTYPFAFLVTDLMNRLEGTQTARRVVFFGFILGLICSFIGSRFYFEVAPDVLVPYVTLRIAIASGTAFLTAQLLDIGIFNLLRDRAWWMPPVISSLFGGVIDTFIFFGIAFSASFIFLEPANDVSWATGATPLLGFGPEFPFWVSMAVADYLVKASIALIALIPYHQTLRVAQA